MTTWSHNLMGYTLLSSLSECYNFKYGHIPYFLSYLFVQGYLKNTDLSPAMNFYTVLIMAVFSQVKKNKKQTFVSHHIYKAL